MKVLGLLQMFSLPLDSTSAIAFERLYDFIFWICMVSFVGIVGAMTYFIIRYHRKRSHPDTTPHIHGHTPRELTVSGILFILVMVIFYWGWIDYVKLRQAPSNAMEVNVIGRQWLWEFEYINGRKMLNELVVPKRQPIKLIMSSADVLHSFFIPSFRIKQDLLPGSYTTLWFEAHETGEYQVYCAEYCGTSHSAMIAKIRVVEQKEYSRWQEVWEITKQLGTPEAEASSTTGKVAAVQDQSERGKQLFTEKACVTCHTVDGKPLVGPTLLHAFGHEMELADGKKVTADENYLRESIMDPQAKLVKGFPPVMPTYKGQLTDDDVNALIRYIKSLKE